MISEQMKQRMSECGKIGAEITNSGVRPIEPPPDKANFQAQRTSQNSRDKRGIIYMGFDIVSSQIMEREVYHYE